jgi:hypothetical protein
MRFGVTSRACNICSVSYAKAADTVRPQYNTQEERGDALISFLKSFQAARPTGGPFVVAGYRFWALLDSRGERMNWGLVNHNDDPYDGISSRTAKGADEWGFATGGTPANYGDFISRVKTANSLWLQLARPSGRGGPGTTGGRPR